MLLIGQEASLPVSPAVWDMSVHMRHARVCDTFLKVAEETYTDFLPRIREDLARAMSTWLMKDGYRAEVEWSDVDACFVGQIRHIPDGGEFRGATPSELKQAFEDAVAVYRAAEVFLLPAPSNVLRLERPN